MKYYIYNNAFWKFPNPINETNIVSHDIADNFDTEKRLPKYVELSDLQVAFHLANPTASVSEVWHMALAIPPQLTNADIEVMRQQAYLNESNPIMFAFRQYFELGELPKYEAKHAEWVSKVQEIRDRYPYITE